MRHLKSLALFDSIFHKWESALEHYSEKDLQLKPGKESWSVGQVYQHLIDATLGFHLPEVRKCLSTADNHQKRKNFKGFVSYHLIGGFPPVRVKVAPSLSYTPQQPEQKASIRQCLEKVRAAMESTAKIMEKDAGGKTLHPAFAYLDAQEWYWLIPMHFKHHLRQKARLDAFLRARKAEGEGSGRLTGIR